MPFDPQRYVEKLKTNGKDYMRVQWRLVWLHADAVEKGLDVAIETEKLVDEMRQSATAKSGVVGRAVFKATVAIGGKSATSHGSETSDDFADYLEKAETKAIGRALAVLGYGTAFAGVDLDEGVEHDRVVDSPVRVSPTLPETRTASPVAPRPNRTAVSRGDTATAQWVAQADAISRPATPGDAIHAAAKPTREFTNQFWKVAAMAGYEKHHVKALLVSLYPTKVRSDGTIDMQVYTQDELGEAVDRMAAYEGLFNAVKQESWAWNDAIDLAVKAGYAHSGEALMLCAVEQLNRLTEVVRGKAELRDGAVRQLEIPV